MTNNSLVLRQDGSVLVIALMFLLFTSVMIIETSQNTRVFYKAAHNNQTSLEALQHAELTCQKAVRLLTLYVDMLSGIGLLPQRDEVVTKGISEDVLDGSARPVHREQTGIPELRLLMQKWDDGDYQKDHPKTWPVLVFIESGHYWGEARVSIGNETEVDSYSNVNHYESYSELNTLQRTVSRVFTLHCSGVSEQYAHIKRWVYRDMVLNYRVF